MQDDAFGFTRSNHRRKNGSGSHLKECKGKSLATVYEKLFTEQLSAHDSLEDVVALGRVLHSNKLQRTLEGMVALARQANTFCEDKAMKAVAKGIKSTIHRLGISDVMKDKISKAGLDKGFANNFNITSKQNDQERF